MGADDEGHWRDVHFPNLLQPREVYHGCSAKDFRGERMIVEATLRELRRVTAECAGHKFVSVEEPVPPAALQLQGVKLDAKAIVRVKSAGRDSFDLIVRAGTAPGQP